MIALVTRARQAHGRLAGELIVPAIMRRALAAASHQSALPTRKAVGRLPRARDVALYLTAVEGRIGLKTLARATGRCRRHMREALAHVEECREDPAFDDFLSQLTGAVRL